MAKDGTVIQPAEAAFRARPEEISAFLDGKPVNEIIGQPRAVRALRMGAEIRGSGFNVFVTGGSGTGRRTAIKMTLDGLERERSDLRDICYVYNFKQPNRPRVLYFNAGRGSEFKKELHHLVENLKSEVKNLLDNSTFKNRRDEIVSIVEREESRRLQAFESVLAKDGLQIIQVQEGESQAADIAPVIEGSPVPFAEFQHMVAAGQVEEQAADELREKYYRYMDELKAVFSELQDSRAMLEEELQSLQLETVRPSIIEAVAALRKSFAGEGVDEYLESLEADLIENLYLFVFDTQFSDEAGNPRLVRYGVNVLEDRSGSAVFPRIYENHPSYVNLFGNIDIVTQSNGERRTNFMMIRSGSLVHASGGFLIVNAEDLLQEEASWYHLKRTLQSGVVELQQQQVNGPWAGPLLKPEPIEIDVKVIIVGSEGMYDALYRQDPDFKKYFKLHAEFTGRMERTVEGMTQYVAFIKKLIADEGLHDADVSGICAVIEAGVRLAEDKTKLSTRFSKITDLVREADYWASQLDKECIDRESVVRALHEADYIAGSVEDEMDELIVNGDVLLSVDGEAVGRVNGLAVFDRGYHRFGKPSVISVRVSPGRQGLVNIEREAGLSGEIHNKGILILEGYLRGAYAGSFPLSVHASICFEQSYHPVDGDSASSTEIYALLSAVGNIPLRQDIAVTGSINQTGQIQPVGGITEKVEGFFRVCKKVGLTGTQGVIIPRQNVRNLMLCDEVLAAIEDGSFSVYPVSHVEAGMDILTGMDETRRREVIEQRLREMAEQVREYSHRP